MEAINKLSSDVHEGFKKVNDNFKQVKEHCSELKSTVEALSKNLKIIKEVFKEQINNLKAENKLLMQRVQTLEDGKKDMEKNILKKMEDRQNARDKVISGVKEEIKERVDKLEDGKTNMEEKILKELDGRQNTRDKVISSVKEELEELKNEIRKLKEARNSKNIKTEESEGINRPVPTLYTINQDNQVLKEMEDRNARRRNVIITGLEEKTGEDIMETVKGLLEKIGSITTSFDTYRIGKANVDKIRPIIVKFENEIEKEQVLCKKWNLKNMTGCEKIFVREDMTWKQRETLMDLIREARERTAEKENEKWTVRGRRTQPYLMKIQQQQQKQHQQ
mgnify:CR=1 FL=1